MGETLEKWLVFVPNLGLVNFFIDFISVFNSNMQMRITITVTEHLICVSPCTTIFIYIFSFDSHKDPISLNLQLALLQMS